MNDEHFNNSTNNLNFANLNRLNLEADKAISEIYKKGIKLF